MAFNLNKILVKEIFYRYYDGEDKTNIQYFVQVRGDLAGNPYDIEITEEQFNKLKQDDVIVLLTRAKSTLPKLHTTPYCCHNITVHIYELKH